MIVSKYILGGLGAVTLACGLVAGVQTFRLSVAHDKLEAAQAALRAAQSANLSNLFTIADLQEANLMWASAMKASDHEKERLRMERDNAQQLAQEAADAERDARQEIYRNDQSAAEWATARVPDRIVRGLRQHAAAD